MASAASGFGVRDKEDSNEVISPPRKRLRGPGREVVEDLLEQQIEIMKFQSEQLKSIASLMTERNVIESEKLQLLKNGSVVLHMD